MCILFELLKVVSHYDLRVLSMSVMGFQKIKLDSGQVGRVTLGGVSSIHFYFGFFGIF